MSEGYSIEVNDELVGVVVRERGERAFTFITDVAAYYPMNGKTFPGPDDAERAARAHKATSRPPSRRPVRREAVGQ